MKVWLDDERDPNDPIIQQQFGATPDMVWVKTSKDAIELLRNGKVEFLSLDHDLGPDDDGYKVARWIEEQAYFKQLKPLKWAIHSQNSVGSNNIKMAMLAAHEYWTLNSM